MNLDLNNIICHSGGASGSDTYFEKYGEEYGVKTKAYSYKTKYHTSQNKVEISEDDYLEGVQQIQLANKVLSRFGINKYMNLLARNWAQVKYSNQTIAIGRILNPGEIGGRGYKNKSNVQIVDGGTGYAVQLSIQNSRPTFVFDQFKEKWYRWSPISLSFIQTDCPGITHQDFAGIGTREINSSGIDAIKQVYIKTFNK
jgi:hypothetical protein